MNTNLHVFAARTSILLAASAACTSALGQERLRGTVVIQDTFSQSRVTSADLFYVLRIGENEQITALDVTMEATRGRALLTTPRVLSTIAPAGEQVITIVGERHYVNEIYGDTQPRMRVQGEVIVRLVEKLTYSVRGSLEPVCCQVWLEDEAGKEVAGTRTIQPPLAAKRPG